MVLEHLSLWVPGGLVLHWERKGGNRRSCAEAMGLCTDALVPFRRLHSQATSWMRSLTSCFLSSREWRGRLKISPQWKYMENPTHRNSNFPSPSFPHGMCTLFLPALLLLSTWQRHPFTLAVLDIDFRSGESSSTDTKVDSQL